MNMLEYRCRKGDLTMKIAFDKVDITPKRPCFMAGYSRKKQSEGILDPIEINSIAFNLNGHSFLISILDSIMLEEDFCMNVKKAVSNQTGIEVNDITISCIHTHSAPAFFKLTFEDTHVEPELTEMAKDEMISSLLRASQNMQECSVELESAMIEGLYGNRNVKGGSEDKEARLFKFYNKDKQLIGSLCNMSAHPTILDGNSFLLSADLLGQIRLRLQNELQCPVAMLNGTCGDVSTRFYRQYSGIEELNFTADNFVKQFLEKKKICTINKGQVKTTTVEMVSHYDAETDEDWQKQMDMLSQVKDRQVDLLIERLNLKKTFGAYDLKLISQIRIFGNIIFFILPGDILSTFGLLLKNTFKNYNVINVGYSNTYCNYFVPENEYGKYFETYTSRLAKGEAEKFINKIIETTKDILA